MSTPVSETINSNNVTTALTTVTLIKQCFNADWNKYNQYLQDLSNGYQLPNCLKLLQEADRLLNQQTDLLESSVAERMLLAGMVDASTNKQYSFDIQVLGGLTGFASFKKVVKNDPQGLNRLMKIIPKTGTVDGWHYLQFVDAFQQWFRDNGHKQTYLYPATRLLTMKRPDQFIPLNEETNPIICDALEIKALKKQDFKRYWDEVIIRIHTTDWFNTFQPMDESQLPFHRVRVALLERVMITPLEIHVHEKLTSSDQNADLDSDVAELVSNTQTDTASVTKTNRNHKTNPFVRDETSTEPKVKAQQPKKMTIAKLQTAKGNKNAATKLMSQYYFANREKFVKINIKKHREVIIERLIEGESVEDIFISFM